MSLFDTNLVEQTFTLSSYTILESTNSTSYWDSDYRQLFAAEVYQKAKQFIGAHGIIDVIGKIPIDYLSEYKNGNERPIRRFIKRYINPHVSFHIEESQKRYSFIFEINDADHLDFFGEYQRIIKCIINVYAR